MKIDTHMKIFKRGSQVPNKKFNLTIYSIFVQVYLVDHTMHSNVIIYAWYSSKGAFWLDHKKELKNKRYVYIVERRKPKRTEKKKVGHILFICEPKHRFSSWLLRVWKHKIQHPKYKRPSTLSVHVSGKKNISNGACLPSITHLYRKGLAFVIFYIMSHLTASSQSTNFRLLSTLLNI